MQGFKLEIYQNEKGKPFTDIETLDQESSNKIIEKVHSILGTEVDGRMLFPEIMEKLTCRDFDEDFTYNLESIFREFDINREGEVYIIWDEDSVDKTSGDNLIKNWDYIWFGESDEAVILYQEDKNSVLLINHYGRICFTS